MERNSRNKFDGHNFKKSLGQNFISDKNLLASIVADAGVDEDDIIIEVGAGAGTLTKELASAAGSVFSFEVDTSLEETLKNIEADFSNLKIIFSDIQKVSLEDIKKLTGGKKYKLVANIPYYITTPIIMKFIEDTLCTEIAVMVQKEVAERIASTNLSGDYGAVSAAIGNVGKARIARIVKKHNFYPVPKVDSALLVIHLDETRDTKKCKEVFKLIRSAFKNRRKKISSNISEDYKISKEELEGILVSMGHSAMARAEELSAAEFMELVSRISRPN